MIATLKLYEILLDSNWVHSKLKISSTWSNLLVSKTNDNGRWPLSLLVRDSVGGKTFARRSGVYTFRLGTISTCPRCGVATMLLSSSPTMKCARGPFDISNVNVQPN